MQDVKMTDERDVKAVVRRMAEYGDSIHAAPRRRRAWRDRWIASKLARRSGRMFSAVTSVLGTLSVVFCVFVVLAAFSTRNPMMMLFVVPALLVPALPWGLLFLASVARNNSGAND